MLSASKRYLGFVDVIDLAYMLLTAGLRRHKPHGLLAKLFSKLVPDEDHTLRMALNFSGRDNFFFLYDDASVLQVWPPLGSPS